MILRLATRDIFPILKLLYKMFCVALEDQTNRRDVPHTSRRFITLLNAFNKVLSRLCSDGSTPCRCLCVCTLIASVVFVCSPLCVPFWQWRCVIAFYFMRGSWFNMMRKKINKKTGPIPKSLAHEFEGSAAAGSRPRFLFCVRRLAPVHADGTSLPHFI